MAHEARVELKPAEQATPTDRPELLQAALLARLHAQKKLISDGPLLENPQGERVPISASPAELGDHRSLPQLAQEGALDEAEARQDSPSATGEGDDPLTNMPGSSGRFGQPKVIERTDGNSLGRYLPLVDPKGSALSHFYGALRDLREAPRDAEGRPRKVRAVVYGASHTQADVYTDYLRTYLQHRFGNGGHGYVSLVRTNRWYRHHDYNVENSRGWIVDRIQKRGILKDGHYGLLGSSARSRRSKHFARVEPRRPNDSETAGSEYVVSFLKQPRGGHFYLYADGKEIAKVRTSGKRKEPGYYRFSLPLGNHSIEVKPSGNGEVRVFGVTIERDQPGVVVDTLGLSGTRASNQLEWNEASWRNSLRQRSPDLYVLAFGTNEATDTHQPIHLYEQQLRTVLARYQRAAPKASCLLVGPGDFAKKIDADTWRQVPRLAQIVEVQRKVAAENNCAYWDALDFMGGEGTIALWSNSYPQMASKDHIHLTRRGYVRMGMDLVDAMMAPFDDEFPNADSQGARPALTQSP